MKYLLSLLLFTSVMTYTGDKKNELPTTNKQNKLPEVIILKDLPSHNTFPLSPSEWTKDDCANFMTGMSYDDAVKAGWSKFYVFADSEGMGDANATLNNQRYRKVIPFWFLHNLK